MSKRDLMTGVGWCVLLWAVVMVLLTRCVGEPTPSPSPVVTPTYPPSPLVAENRAEGGRERFVEPGEQGDAPGTGARAESLETGARAEFPETGARADGEEVIQVEQVPVIGGFEVVFLVMGIAALIKSFVGPRGKVLLACAVGLGVVFNGVALAISGGLVPEAAAVWVVLFVRAVGYALATPGLYDLLRDDLLPAIGKTVVGDDPINLVGGDPINSVGGDPINSVGGDPINSVGGDPINFTYK